MAHKERPVAMRTHDVRAILDGRKTQARFAVKRLGSDTLYVQKPDWLGVPAYSWHEATRATQSGWMLPDVGGSIACPYGVPGDRLWVRETWADFCPHWEHWCGCGSTEMQARLHRRIYRADGEPSGRIGWRGKWSQSTHMPRWASRLTLEVVSVRVERLQDISEEDARAEGACEWALESDRRQDEWARWTRILNPEAKTGTARGAFAALWVSVNGAESWDANPWVWVVDFRRELAAERPTEAA